LGTAAAKLRSTRSGARHAFWSRAVVVIRLRRLTPRSLRMRISRATRLQPVNAELNCHLFAD
jgi:hypothetical protein